VEAATDGAGRYAEALRVLGMPEFLDLEDLEDLVVIAGIATGGPALVRDHGLLASAVPRTRTTVFGEDAYPTLPEKAAALLHSLARNRPLVDGNKRLAWLATHTFLRITGVALRTDDDAVVELVVAVADRTLDEVGGIARRLAAWA
jgi:death on curing protein